MAAAAAAAVAAEAPAALFDRRRLPVAGTAAAAAAAVAVPPAAAAAAAAAGGSSEKGGAATALLRCIRRGTADSGTESLMWCLGAASSLPFCMWSPTSRCWARLRVSNSVACTSLAPVSTPPVLPVVRGTNSTVRWGAHTVPVSLRTRPACWPPVSLRSRPACWPLVSLRSRPGWLLLRPRLLPPAAAGRDHRCRFGC